jgi:glycosyltransferase involved in cell wall biosynthesis
MARIVKEVPDVKCFIAGKRTRYTTELEILRGKQSLRDKVVFTGFLDSHQLVKAYQRASTYAFTSPEEDFGLGPIEAAACGVPSVVWDHAGPRETVVQGVTGYRVKPYSIEKMAERHVELLNDEKMRTSMGKNARRLVKQSFSWERHSYRMDAAMANVEYEAMELGLCYKLVDIDWCAQVHPDP